MEAKLEIPQTSQGIANIAAKMASIMQAISWLEKESEVQMGGRTAYAYTSEAQFIAEIRPLMVEYGVLVIPTEVKDVQVVSKGDKSFVTTLVVRYMFVDSESGEYIVAEMAGQGADATDKGLYKALTGAYKYLFREAFLIGTGDDPEATDDTGKSVSRPKADRKPKQTQMQRIVSQAENRGVDLNAEPYASLWKEQGIDLDKVESKAIMEATKEMVKAVLGGTEPEDAVANFSYEE